MPTYQYKCKNNHITDVFEMSVKDMKEAITCKCGEIAKKIMSLPIPEIWKCGGKTEKFKK